MEGLIMLLPNLELNKIDEFKNFSLNDLFNNEYTIKIDGELPEYNDNSDFFTIDIVNGVPSTRDISDGIEINNLSLGVVDTFNVITNMNIPFQDMGFEIAFTKSLTKPVLVKNFFTGNNSFTPSYIRYTLLNEAKIDLLETCITVNDDNGNEATENVVTANNNREFNIVNATLNYSRVDQINEKSTLIFNYFGNIKKGKCTAVTLNNTGLLNMNNWDINLIDKDSFCSVYGVINLKNSMRHGTICKIKHFGKETFSTQEFRHILDGDCYAMYDGDSYIDNKAKDSVTSQNSKAIMLSNGSRILNKPRLNIFTGEVKATHGATVGKLNDDDIFYLKQRGLPFTKIKKILINAFVLDILDKVSCESIREFLYDKR